MRAVKLEELIPQPAEFELAATGKTYHLRKITLDDEIWLAETFGARFQSVMAGEDMKSLARLAFRLLVEKDDLKAQEVAVVDEEGVTHKRMLGGVNLLLSMISGQAEKESLVRAIWQTIGVSRPLQDEIISEAEKAQKKSQSGESLTGGSSSMPSPVSTDGPSSKSEGAA